MADFIIMPKLGLNMDSGKLTRWLKKEGDSVAKGEVVCEIETDKAVMEVESSTSGVVRRLLAAQEQNVPVTLPIAIVGTPGEDIVPMLVEAAALLGTKVDQATTENVPVVNVVAAAASGEVAGRRLISPRARRYLKEHNVDAASIAISGSGPEGSVVEADVINFLKSRTGVPVGASTKVAKQDLEAPTQRTPVRSDREILTTIPYTGVRRVIGERLSQSKFTAPHLYFTTSVDMSRILSLRTEFNEAQKLPVSMNTLIVKAGAEALQAHPELNASLVGEDIVQYRSVNIGIAVAAQNGLIVPVVRNVQDKTLLQLSIEAEELITKAQAGKLMPDDYQSGTFTISNLGMFGVENFTAIINPPEAAILSVSSILKKAVVITENGADVVVIRPMMSVTVSVDHRLIDGLAAVQFLGAVKDNLEKPLSLLL
jgi:pyruvate dehydrogenase E2 component (dihydrolipoamide acetyltransferase)